MGKFYDGLYDSLSLYVRHSAWLHAVPKEAKVSRLEDLNTKGQRITMPMVSAPHLIDYLYEIGPGMPGAMGSVPLSQSEIAAWQSNIGIELQAWEARFLVRLSKEYLGEYYRADAPTRAAPWTDIADIVDREHVSRSVFAALESMRKAK